MFVPFDVLLGSSRVWIYQADRAFTMSEEEKLNLILRNFCDQWQAHGNPLRASFELLYHQVIVLSVDEKQAGASGCSIDGSVHMLKLFGEQTGLDFFDRTRIGFLSEGHLKTYFIKDLKTAFASGVINGDSLTFNPIIASKDDWKSNWILPASRSWLSKYLPESEIV